MADNFLTRKVGPLPAWGWAAVAGGGFLVYRWWKGRKSSTATTTTTPTGASSTTVIPTPGGVTLPPGSGSGYGGGGGGYIPPGAPPVSTTKTTPAKSGPPTVTIGGTSYDILGQVPSTPNKPITYQVYGGAPVYFGYAGGGPTGIKQGPTNNKPGNFVYTPAAYSNLVYKTGTPAP